MVELAKFTLKFYQNIVIIMQIFIIIFVYMAGAGTQTLEKPNYTLRDQDMELRKERDRLFFL